ncbi:MAG: efflux RND transporter periplasmic adaptor subunit [Bradyrhizobiaceae bacterium]|nr:efflux RND transporter periplasmic adaptor subunit [Bradyrhizobiaceae bacterium]
MQTHTASTFLVALLILAGITPAKTADFVVRSITVPDMKAVFGRVESTRIVPARARIGGSIREIRVSEGDQVKEGQVVAVVIDDKLALELNAAEAKIEALNSQVENARTELDRAQQLLARGVATQARVDQAKTQFDVVVNQVAAAQAEKSVVEQRAREGEILAPAGGRILTVPVTLGSVVLAGEEIARIAAGRYYLRLSLPERHAAEIRENAAVRIGRRGLSPAASGGIAEALPGRVAKVYPEIASGRVIADVEVDGIGDYFVNERTLVWIPVAQRSVIAVPAEAVTTRHGIDYVRIAADNGALEIAVILGEAIETGDGLQIEVLTGLRDGDRVVMPDPKP